MPEAGPLGALRAVHARLELNFTNVLNLQYVHDEWDGEQIAPGWVLQRPSDALSDQNEDAQVDYLIEGICCLDTDEVMRQPALQIREPKWMVITAERRRARTYVACPATCAAWRREMDETEQWMVK